MKSTDSPSLPRNEVAHEGRYGPVAQLQERDTSPNGTVFRQHVDMVTKACKTCGVEKPLSEFTHVRNRVGKWYAMGECKPCRSAREQERKNDSKIRERRERVARERSEQKRAQRQAEKIEARNKKIMKRIREGSRVPGCGWVVSIVAYSDEFYRWCRTCQEWKHRSDFWGRAGNKPPVDTKCRTGRPQTPV